MSEKDSYGNFSDITGQKYTTSSGLPATHGSEVDIIDGTGQPKPGYMISGQVIPAKKD